MGQGKSVYQKERVNEEQKEKVRKSQEVDVITVEENPVYLSAPKEGELTPTDIKVIQADEHYKKSEYDKSFRLYHEIANATDDCFDPYVFNQLGIHYCCGKGIPINIGEAEKYFKKMAESKSPRADIGYINLAAITYRKAVKQGNREGIKQAVMYLLSAYQHNRDNIATHNMFKNIYKFHSRWYADYFDDIIIGILCEKEKLIRDIGQNIDILQKEITQYQLTADIKTLNLEPWMMDYRHNHYMDKLTKIYNGYLWSSECNHSVELYEKLQHNVNIYVNGGLQNDAITEDIIKILSVTIKYRKKEYEKAVRECLLLPQNIRNQLGYLLSTVCFDGLGIEINHEKSLEYFLNFCKQVRIPDQNQKIRVNGRYMHVPLYHLCESYNTMLYKYSAYPAILIKAVNSLVEMNITLKNKLKQVAEFKEAIKMELRQLNSKY